MRSWVPQMREDGGVTVTYETEGEYFPEMDAEILTKKQEKPKQVYQYSNVSRADTYTSSSGSSNPPRFQGGNKGGFKPLEHSEQEKRLMDIDE